MHSRFSSGALAAATVAWAQSSANPCLRQMPSAISSPPKATILESTASDGSASPALGVNQGTKLSISPGNYSLTVSAVPLERAIRLNGLAARALTKRFAARPGQPGAQSAYPTKYGASLAISIEICYKRCLREYALADRRTAVDGPAHRCLGTRSDL